MKNYLSLFVPLIFLFSSNVYAVDSDSDGIPDQNDNCPNVANLECSMMNGQYTCIMPDSDGDGIGDACEDFDVDLNTFENGQVADANQVNENFEKLKAAVEEIKTLVDINSCLAVEGAPISGQCINPELELDNLIVPAGSQSYELFSFDTSEFKYEASNYFEISIGVSNGDDFTSGLLFSCNLRDENGNIYSLRGQPRTYGTTLRRQISIDYRGAHQILCTTNSLIDVDEIYVDFEFMIIPRQDSDGDGLPDGDDYFPLDPLEWDDADRDGVGNNSDPSPYNSNP